MENTFKETLEQMLADQQSDKLKGRVFGSLNLKVLDCDEENHKWADFYYEKQEQYLNPYNGVHGGMACVIADSCMGITICAATDNLPSTTDMSTSYLAPMRANAFRVHCELKMAGNQLAGTYCEITDYAKGTLCVTCMAKYIMLRKDLLAGRGHFTGMKKSDKQES